MTSETHNHLGQAHIQECTRAVIRNTRGTPVVVVVEVAPDQIWTVRRGDPNFESTLQKMGVRDTVVKVHTFDREQLAPSLPGRLLLPGEEFAG